MTALIVFRAPIFGRFMPLNSDISVGLSLTRTCLILSLESSSILNSFGLLGVNVDFNFCLFGVLTDCIELEVLTDLIELDSTFSLPEAEL